MAYRPMKSLAEFHRAVGEPEYDPRVSYVDKLVLRLSLIREEFEEVEQELVEAINPGGFNATRESLAKELADLLYVVYGTAEMLGLPLEKVFQEVHRSNMSKLGSDGKPILREDGKILKGPNYRQADVHGVLTGEWL